MAAEAEYASVVVAQWLKSEPASQYPWAVGSNPATCWPFFLLVSFLSVHWITNGKIFSILS